jgi:hypothetical protein
LQVFDVNVLRAVVIKPKQRIIAIIVEIQQVIACCLRGNPAATFTVTGELS